MEQQTGVKSGKEYVKAVYCHPAYLTYMQSIFNLYSEYICEMLDWMKHKLELRLLGEISITSNMHKVSPYGRKQRGTVEPLDKSEREE